MVTQLFFTIFLLALSFQRLWEVRLSEKNRQKLLSRGGREHAKGQMPWMFALHTMWLLAMPIEVWFLNRTFHVLVFVPAFILVLLGQTLRLLAIHQLKERWTARIITVPGELPVSSGVFACMRHPNYLGVILEIAFVPLLHTAYLTSLVFSLLNGVLLFFRIRAEERALDVDNDYLKTFKGKSRFMAKK